MKWTRFLVNNRICFGLLQGNRVQVAEGDIFGDYRLTDMTFDLSGVKLLAPVVPGKVVCIGKNYLAHIEEIDKGAPVPQEPVMFMVSPTAIIGPGEEIVIPYPEHETHYEAELVVVIGKKGRDIPVERAGEYIFGLTCGNDVSDRTLQKADGQWTRAKSLHTFKPLGPYIITELDPAGLQVMSRVNGVPKQNGNTADLIHHVPALISFVSRVMTLYPGDVIYTGTPEGVGPLVSGDTCEIEIRGIGILENPVC